MSFAQVEDLDLRHGNMALFAALRGCHAGETMLVCGLGRSLNRYQPGHGLTTIGVNDVGRKFTPEYLVVLNGPQDFSGDRWQWVHHTRARAVFSQLDLSFPHSHLVPFQLGEKHGTSLENPCALPYTKNSPYVALALAAHMGAKRIGLLGVDFSRDHFFARDGEHALNRELRDIDGQYGRLVRSLADRGIEVFNLSEESRLTSIPKMAWDTFVSCPVSNRQMDRRMGAMRVTVERHPPGTVAPFMNRLSRTLREIGIDVKRVPYRPKVKPDYGDVSFVWNGRFVQSKGIVICCEHGWLPTSFFQMGLHGVNGGAHFSPFEWDGQPLSQAGMEAIQGYNHALKMASIRKAGKPDYGALRRLPSTFILVPLQIEQDSNIVFQAPKHLRTMQGLVDFVSDADLDLPVIFKQHPVDKKRGNQHLKVRKRRRQDIIMPHGSLNIHHLMACGLCKGVISINSNSIHDAMIWDLPAVALGRHAWPRQGVSPFLRKIPPNWERAEMHFRRTRDCRFAYTRYLLRYQWSLSDLDDHQRLANFFDECSAFYGGARGPVQSHVPVLAKPEKTSLITTAFDSIKKGSSFVRRAASKKILNLVAKDRGWLFEDLKGHASRRRYLDCTVVTSEEPLHNADAWMFIRTEEAIRTPDPRRTVVQIHDLYEGDLYAPGGRRHGIKECGGFVLIHPYQKAILGRAGVDLEKRPFLCRPLGYLEMFELNRKPQELFNIGWVGRRAIHDGVNIKRPEWLLAVSDCLSLDPNSYTFSLVGEGLDDIYHGLIDRGEQCHYFHRRHHSIESYPRLYGGMDCLLISSLIEGLPTCMFEAMASGVPIIGTPVGWVPTLIQHGVEGFVVENEREMAEAVMEIYRNRGLWQSKAGTIRKQVEGLTLESWLDETVSLSMQVVGAL